MSEHDHPNKGSRDGRFTKQKNTKPANLNFAGQVLKLFGFGGNMALINVTNSGLANISKFVTDRERRQKAAAKARKE